MLTSKHEQGRGAGGKGRRRRRGWSSCWIGDVSMGDVFALIKGSLGETYGGTLDPRTAGGLASLVNALVWLCEIGELELRMKMLEEREE